jgi:rhamnogalacturonan endolyase
MKNCAILKRIFLSILAAAIFADFAAAGVRYMENLDRGVVAVRTSSSQVYIGWRMLGTEWGQNIGYHVYRNGTKITSLPITTSTNYVHSITTDGAYGISAVVDGIEGPVSETVSVWNNSANGYKSYKILPLSVPAAGTTPNGVIYTYSPNDCSVGDLDGDGGYEIIVKWDPNNAKDNSQSGYTGNVYLDAYKLDGTQLWRIDLGKNIRAGAHYTQFMVYDLDSDGKAEVACKTAPGTIDGQGNYVLMGTDSPTADYRNSSGYILSGPEYLTVFNGQTGAAMATTSYNPPRGTVSSWGDSYGNRVDRFLACVAYLDGARPSLVMCRGYYTRAAIVAWDWRDGQLTQRWIFDTGFSGGTWSAYKGQGNHNLSVCDADGDGKDEIIYGACAIDDNGLGLYTTGLGHGDAMHVSDMLPDRPGQEVWQCHEGGTGSTLRDAATGEILIQHADANDVGRACAAHIDSAYPGYQVWSPAYYGKGTYTTGNVQISTTRPSINFLAWWDGDLQRELVDSVSSKNPKIDKWNGNGVDRLLSLYNWPTAYGCESNNSTKSNPCLTGDILGDWREELIYRLSDNTGLLICTTTTVTTYRFYTLMHDCQYREAIAWQNVAYNQPPHPSFYIGAEMAALPTPQIRFPEPPLYGDFDDDTFVNINDLMSFLDLWLVNNCTQTAALDLNADCIVNYIEFSAMASNWTGPDTVVPSAPTGLTATAGNATVSLDWNDNSDSDMSGYNIYRSMTSGAGFVKINTVLLSNSNYTDTNVVNGTTYYYVVTVVDISANESVYSSEVSAKPGLLTSLTIQENTTGFCTIDGTVDSNHLGYTGTGFANANNAVGAGIGWRINIPSAGTYTVIWRHSNGTTTNRPGNLLVNGSAVVSGINFPGTGDWDTWVDVPVEVSFNAGVQDLRLNATTSNGLSNIDYLMVTGASPEAASCN